MSQTLLQAYNTNGLDRAGSKAIKAYIQEDNGD